MNLFTITLLKMHQIFGVLFVLLLFTHCGKEKLANVTTLENMTIGTNSAVIHGSLKNDGGSPIIKKGICYSFDSLPDLTNVVLYDNGTKAKYSILIENLLFNTTYFARAFVQNGIGISYGKSIRFTTVEPLEASIDPELTTSQATLVTQSSAILGGSISSNTGISISSRGFCLNTTPHPIIKYPLNSSGTGSFSSSFTGLNESTTYYFRTFCTCPLGTIYGEEVSFTTISNSTLSSYPSVTTFSSNLISANSATCNANISSSSSISILSRGFCAGTSLNPTSQYVASTSGLGDFSLNITGLNSLTTYYVRAFCTTSLGTFYGANIIFTTLAPIASLITTNNCNSLSGINSNYQGLNGTSDSWGISTGGHIGNCWIAPDPLNSGDLGSTSPSGTNYIEFTRTFNNSGYFTFWFNTYPSPSLTNIQPTIYIDGVAQTSPTFSENSYHGWFMQATSSIITAGFHTIKIKFIGIGGTNCFYKIDELMFYEY